jgi:hypothetical protein
MLNAFRVEEQLFWRAAHLQQRALGSQVGFDSKLTANP